MGIYLLTGRPPAKIEKCDNLHFSNRDKYYNILLTGNIFLQKMRNILITRHNLKGEFE